MLRQCYNAIGPGQIPRSLFEAWLRHASTVLVRAYVNTGAGDRLPLPPELRDLRAEPALLLPQLWQRNGNSKGGA